MGGLTILATRRADRAVDDDSEGGLDVEDWGVRK